MSRVTGLSISKSNRIGVEMVSQATTPFPSALVVYQLRLGESAPDAAALVGGDLADVCANEVAGGMMAPPPQRRFPDQRSLRRRACVEHPRNGWLSTNVN